MYRKIAAMKMVAAPPTVAALIGLVSRQSGVARLLRREWQSAIGPELLDDALRGGLARIELVGCAEHGAITELDDGRLYCEAGGHEIERDKSEVVDIDLKALADSFCRLTGTKLLPGALVGDLVLVDGEQYDLILCLSDQLLRDRPHEVLGLHMFRGKPLKACVSEIKAPQIEPFGIFGLEPQTAVALGPTGTERLPENVSQRVRLGGETWRQLYESFRNAGISPDLELMCAAVDEASALSDLARLAASGAKGIGAKAERLLYFAMRRVFPDSLALNPEATGKELPDGFVFTVEDSKISFFYDSKARLEDYSLVASERRKLDTYFERSTSTLQTHPLVGGCLVSTSFDAKRISEGGQSLVAKHNLPVVLATFEGLMRLASWDLHPVLTHILRIARQPKPNSMFVEALFRPEILSAKAGILADALGKIRRRFARQNPDWAELAASRVFHWPLSLLLAAGATVALIHTESPIEAELNRLERSSGRPPISITRRLRDRFPPESLVSPQDWTSPQQLDHGAVLPLEVAYIVAVALAHEDASYVDASHILAELVEV